MADGCSVDGCNNPVLARGWCRKHYYRWKRRGTVDDWPGCRRDGPPCCTECGAGLVVSKNWYKSQADRRHYLCKTCRREPDRAASQRYRDRHREKVNEYARRWLQDHPLYRTWTHMVRRCTEPEVKSYPNYGGRGIQVCEQWLGGYEGYLRFVQDMGPKPGPSHSLDRIDNDGNYEPGNCRWADRSTQARNRRQVSVLTAEIQRLRAQIAELEASQRLVLGPLTL